MEIKLNKEIVEKLFGVGAHYGYSRARRHPSTKNFIFGTKNSVEIFDLGKTSAEFEKALQYIESLAKEGKQILFVSGKREAQEILEESAKAISMPYVSGRWIGGTLTNFEEIRKRVDRMKDILEKRESGELAKKYTKREQMLLSKESEDLEAVFGGLVSMEKLPSAMFVIDSDHESLAVKEARDKGIPVIGLSSSDCDLSKIDHAIPANDSNIKSITFFLNAVVDSYKKSIKKS